MRMVARVTLTPINSCNKQDSDKFPIKQAELYHQFHDGFMNGEQYPQSYNSITDIAVADGRLKPTGCPNRDGSY